MVSQIFRSVFTRRVFALQKQGQMEFEKLLRTNPPKVLILYTTKNDFLPNCLSQSLKQDYVNYETYILDDSTDPTFIEMIDKFAVTHNVRVVRRGNIGPRNKAGNINHLLMSVKPQYDYFVMLDADEIIPNNYISANLPFFYAKGCENLGYLQSTHSGYKTDSFFSNVFMRDIESTNAISLFSSAKTSFVQHIGHGVLISRNCYEKIGGLPNIVAEDQSSSLIMYKHGMTGIHSNVAPCSEMAPLDYIAARKRNVRNIYAQIEIIKKMLFGVFRYQQK